MTNPADDSALARHITRSRVPLFEVDLGQGVYHGNYFHLLESAREDFLRHIGHPYRRFMDRQMHLAVAEASCTYRKSLHYDDEIEIHTSIPWRRSRSLAFSQIIYRLSPDGAEICTRAELKMVCVKFSGQATVVPPEFFELVDKWAAGARRRPSAQ